MLEPISRKDNDCNARGALQSLSFGIIALSSAVTAIIFKNILFALLILIGAFTVALFAVKKPHLIHFEITKRGIAINDVIYPFNTLESFWTDEDEHGHLSLILKSERIIMLYIIMPLYGDVDTIRNILSKLEEEEHHEPLSHRILEFFGF